MSEPVRKTVGVIMLLSFFSCSAGMAAIERTIYRYKSGDAESEPALEVIRAHVEAAYAKNGKLCDSSIAQDPNPFVDTGDEHYLARATRAERAAEREQNAGFFCLGIGPNDIVPGENAYWYASNGTVFSVRAFRSELYDPNGTLPQWEIDGEVVDGKLVVDSRIHRLPGGGPTFPGHPQPRGHE